MSETRLEAQRTIPASRAAIFKLISDPAGHAAIDGSGMLMSAPDGKPVTAVGDWFVMDMDREALGDYPMGKYQVRCTITAFEQDKQLEWNVAGIISMTDPIGHVYGYLLEDAPDGGTVVTSYYDWTNINDDFRKAGIFPVIPQTSLRQTLGILERVVTK